MLEQLPDTSRIVDYRYTIATRASIAVFHFFGSIEFVTLSRFRFSSTRQAVHSPRRMYSVRYSPPHSWQRSVVGFFFWGGSFQWLRDYVTTLHVDNLSTDRSGNTRSSRTHQTLGQQFERMNSADIQAQHYWRACESTVACTLEWSRQSRAVTCWHHQSATDRQRVKHAHRMNGQLRTTGTNRH